MKVLYGFYQLFRHYRRLANVKRQCGVASVLDINFDSLKQKGIEALVLDFDGVLAHHGALKPREDVLQWLQQVHDQETFKLYILSNKPTSSRATYFKEHFPKIRFIRGVRKKPYPDGILAIAQDAEVKPAQIAMVDDRLLTGSLSAVIAGAKVIYIKRAYHRFWHNPIVEGFFMALRFLEKMLIL